MTVVAPQITLAYVVKGFWAEVAKNPLPDSATEWAGEIGMVETLCDRANLVEQMWKTLGFKEVTGVWDYEISEPFGKWLAEQTKANSELPDEAECLAKLANLATAQNFHGVKKQAAGIQKEVYDDSDGEPRYIATSTPAVWKDVSHVLRAPTGTEDGRSDWHWLRLANGDLILGVYPRGDTYLQLVEHLGV